MKNIRISVLLIVFAFFFSSVPLSVNAISSNASITGVKQEKSKIGEKIASLHNKIKSQIEKVFLSDDKKPSLFWLWATLLILGGMILGVVLIVLGVFAAFGGTATANLMAIILLLLGVFLPIVSLFFAFRPLLRNHFKKIGKEITKKKINLYAFLMSIAPGILATLFFLIGF